MLKKLLTACVLLSISATALGQVQGQWIGGVGYFDLTADIDGVEVSPDVYGLNLGYKFDLGLGDFSIMPSMSLYGDIDDDIVDVPGNPPTPVRVETSFGMGFNVRFQWDGDENFYFYFGPSLTRFDIDGRTGTVKVNDDEWEAGGGAGIGFQINDQFGVELSYDEFKDSDMLGLALRYAF
jgi:hypothetical protein